MSENKVVWHPYPIEKPLPGLYYNVTVVRGDGTKFVDLMYSDYGRFIRKESSYKVIAWAEIPEPHVRVTMTKKSLIEALEELPDDTQICIPSFEQKETIVKALYVRVDSDGSGCCKPKVTIFGDYFGY